MVKVRIRIGVRIIFSVWLFSCYAHMFVLLSVVIVTLHVCAHSPAVIGTLCGSAHEASWSSLNMKTSVLQQRRFEVENY